MSMSRPIAPGQEFVSATPTRVASASSYMPNEHYVRIRVKGVPRWSGFNKVTVVTVLPGGREVRPRAIEASQLHDTATTQAGQPRTTGYILDTTKEQQ